jgi:hypothetical protein
MKPVTDGQRATATFRIGVSLFHDPAGVMPDASAITKALGMEPTSTHNAGEAHGSGAARWKHGQWALTSPLPEDIALEPHIEWLLDRLLPVQNRVREVLQSDSRLKADFFCGLWFTRDNEGLGLRPATLQAIGSLGAELNLDIYFETNSTNREALVDAVLDELCSEQGFCLRPEERAQMLQMPTDDLDAFVNALFVAERLDEPYDPHLWRGVRDHVGRRLSVRS